MTTAVTNAATLAAFAERYRDRPWCHFDQQPWPVQGRWTLVCTKVVQRVITGPRALRDEYHRGFSGVKAWTELSRADRESWDRVYLAAVRAWQAAEAQEREVAA